MSFRMSIVARPSAAPYVTMGSLLSVLAWVQFRVTDPFLLTLFRSLPVTLYGIETATVVLLFAAPLLLWRFTLFVLDAESLQLYSSAFRVLRKKVSLGCVRHIRIVKSGPLSFITGSRRVEFIDVRGRTVFEWSPVRPNDELLRKLRRTSLLLLSEYRMNMGASMRRTEDNLME